MAQKFLNNFDSVFVASVKDTPGTGTPDTELDYGILRLSDGAAAFLTNPTGGDFYVLTAFKREGTTETNREIMRVTAVDNSTTGECRVTVKRGQEGTSVKAYLSGDYVSLRLTAGAVNDWVAQFDIAKNNADIATNQANIATNQANIATTKADNATAQADRAATAAANADADRIAAQDAAAAAAASYDSFDDRYLGAKASDPTLDNDGNALIEGALYWNSTVKEHRTWNGTAWVTTSVANAVSRGGDTMTGNLTVPSLNGGQLAGNRRRNLNGDCRIAQLGTSYPAANGHTIDMWRFGCAGAQVSTVTQEADAPAGSGFVYSHRSTVTTADAAIAAGDYAIHHTVIEGYDVADLVGKTFTVSFRVRSAKAGVHCVALRNSGLDRSYVHEFTIAAANTWETHKFTVTGGLPTGGTWNFTNGVGLEVDFTLASGSTYHTTADAWQTGNFLATANQVNVLDTIGNIFAVTGLQVELGDTATPYERRSIGAETTQVQRYGRLNGGLSGWTTSTTFINGLAVDFSSNPMRATPTIQLVNGTNTAHDPGIAMRDFSAPSYGGTNLGGYVSGTVSATTANKLHNLLQGTVFFDARL